MTLCTLDTNALKKTRNAYGIISVIVLICDIISEFYSHGIYSLFSRLAFLIPLIGGAAVYTAFIKLSQGKTRPGIWAYRLYNTGIACLTVGASVRGALDVYGTNNHLVGLFLWFALASLVASMVITVHRREKRENN